MHDAIARMLEKYNCQSSIDYTNALREILQEIALLGLWRGKFFEKAAFYGGTALRIIHGLDRFSEDVDFSLLQPDNNFDLSGYSAFLQKECEAFGFEVSFDKTEKSFRSPIQSAFLKAQTRKQLLVFETTEEILQAIPRGKILKIKIEVDTDPPPGFNTQTRYLLHPVPFAVRIFSLPDLFAGKMHAILCRKWQTRVKGRDWYDFVWYTANHPQLHLYHLEQRMRQTDDWQGVASLSEKIFRERLAERISSLNIDQVREEVEPFIKTPDILSIWSRDFFLDIALRIQIV